MKDWIYLAKPHYKSVELMQQHNIKFYSIKENIDTSSIYGKFTINLLSSLYEMELGLISERVSDTLKWMQLPDS